MSLVKLFGKAEPPVYALQVNHIGEWVDSGWFDPARLDQVKTSAPDVAKLYKGGVHAPVLRIVDEKTQRVLWCWNHRDGWSRA